jgi:hypothetical protein
MAATTSAPSPASAFADQQQTVFIIGLISSILSLVSTVTVITLLIIMKKRNGYLWIIFNMAVAQLFFDVTNFLANVDSGFAIVWRAILESTSTFSSTIVIFWTNVSSMVVFYIVNYSVSFDIVKWLYWLAAAVILPALIMSAVKFSAFFGSTTMQEDADIVSIAVRSAGIIFNFVLCGFILYDVNMVTNRDEACARKELYNSNIRVRGKQSLVHDHPISTDDDNNDVSALSSSSSSSYLLRSLSLSSISRTISSVSWSTASSKASTVARQPSASGALSPPSCSASPHTASVKLTNKKITLHSKALQTLAQRMVYYPIMQFFVFAPRFLYDAVYNGVGPFTGANSSTQFGWACIYSIMEPSAGLWYLIIFLAMQPNAWAQFKRLFVCDISPIMMTKQRLAVKERDNNVISSSASITGSINNWDVKSDGSATVISMQDYDEDQLVSIIERSRLTIEGDASFATPISDFAFGVDAELGAAASSPITARFELLPVSARASRIDV